MDQRERVIALHIAGKKPSAIVRETGVGKNVVAGLIHRYRLSQGHTPIKHGSNFPKDGYRMAALSDEIVREIRDRRAAKELCKTIAYDFDISIELVSQIANFRAYEHVK